MGSTFRFVHCADLHLGCRFKGVTETDPETGRRMRESPFRSFSRIVDLTIREKADALVISGDVYDYGNALPSTRLFFARETERAGVPVFVCRGNHDSRQSWDSAIPYPGNVTEFGEEPSTHRVDSAGGPFEVTGVSFSDPHETRDLATQLRGGPDIFTIACVHCDVDSASEGYGYAPCRQADLSGKGVDYWALGHIHKRRILSEDPYIVYPGNIQGRSPKETGRKGAYLVTVTDGRVTGMEFVPTQEIIWREFNIAIDGKDMNSLLESVPECRGEVVRLRFTGSGDLNHMIRSHANDICDSVASARGCIMLPPKVQCSPAGDGSVPEGFDRVLAEEAEALRSLSKQGILDVLAGHKMASKFIDSYRNFSEEDLRSIVTEATAMVMDEKGASR